MVAILMDQNVLRREAVFVDFFGRPAATTPGPATFHLRTGAPILPVFCSPVPGGRYHIQIHPPLRIDKTGDAGRDIHRITQACTRLIEEQIRLKPDLWFWFHDRWRTRPPAEPGNS
jgi:KDO2-lipid IV(A) lauroyltransferase